MTTAYLLTIKQLSTPAAVFCLFLNCVLQLISHIYPKQFMLILVILVFLCQIYAEIWGFTFSSNGKTSQ